MVLMSIDPSADSHCNISVESVLRLRPIAKKEAEDSIVLEQVQSVGRNAPATVVLNPIHAGALASPIAGGPRGRSESDTTANNTPTEYHFNHVLSDSTSQDKIYYTLGLPIATAAMSSLKPGVGRGSSGPKSHLLVCMGVAGSGKTYTSFGGTSISKRRASQDGLVPRLVDSLFSQSKHHANSGNGSKGFAVHISIAQVTHCKGSAPHECVIHDLLGTCSAEQPKEKKKMTPKRNLTVRGMAAKFERAIGSPILSPLKSASNEPAQLDLDNIELSIEACTDVTQAREVLQKGITNSVKAAKAQNHHLLITLQPVSNGNQLGDKIAILDMAGLEKGRKSQSRGKDSVANKNQEASAAVLHCLRTMIHNTNVRSGKSDAIDVADDAISEISSVSQEKRNPLHRQLKPVPFRQHKVTMLLQSLFTKSVFSKVTLILAAYPGHADFYEKRILLQDMELLCGTALTNARANAATGLHRIDSQSIMSADSQSTLTRGASLDEDDRSVDQGSIHSFRDKSKRYRNTSPQSLVLSASFDEVAEKVGQPPAYAPSYSKTRAVSRSDPAPTAPPLEAPDLSVPPAHVSNDSSAPKTLRNPDYVSDFPGVHLPAKKQLCDPVAERQRVTSVYSSSNTGGRMAPVPSGEHWEGTQERDLTKRQHILENRTSRPKQVVEDNKTTRQPLARSSLENGQNDFDHEKSLDDARKVGSRYSTNKEDSYESVTPKTYEAISVPQRKVSTPETGYQPSSHRKAGRNNGRSSNDRSSRETERRSARAGQAYPSPGRRQSIQFSHHDQDGNPETSLEAERRIYELEKKMKDLGRAKESYEKKCNDLEGENERLKLSVKETVVKAQSKWTRQDEEQFLKCREARLEDQTLVKKPLRRHMDRVNYIYDIKNQWCKTDKPHFDLTLPSHFQRAPDLDVRDREWDAQEVKVALGQESYAPPAEEDRDQLSPQGKFKYRKMGMKAKEPSSFSALKKLIVNT